MAIQTKTEITLSAHAGLSSTFDNEHARQNDHKWLPHENLMIGILSRAIKDLQGKDRYLIRGAEREDRLLHNWFYSNDESYLFSYEHICTVLGVGPETLRKELEAEGLLSKDGPINPDLGDRKLAA